MNMVSGHESDSLPPDRPEQSTAAQTVSEQPSMPDNPAPKARAVKQMVISCSCCCLLSSSDLTNYAIHFTLKLNIVFKMHIKTFGQWGIIMKIHFYFWATINKAHTQTQQTGFVKFKLGSPLQKPHIL